MRGFMSFSTGQEYYLNSDCKNLCSNIGNYTMKFEISSLLSLLLLASSVTAGPRKHNHDSSPPGTVITGDSSPHNETPPTINPTSIKSQQRIIKDPGIVRCWLDEHNQTLAILEMSNYAVSPNNTVPHYPYSAQDGKATFTIRFDNGVPGLQVRMVQTWNLDHPVISTDGKSFSFEEIEGGVNPGGTFMFLGAKSCFEGAIKPDVRVQINAVMNVNQPVHVDIQS
jgi:hypothetical protein